MKESSEAAPDPLAVSKNQEVVVGAAPLQILDVPLYAEVQMQVGLAENAPAGKLRL